MKWVSFLSLCVCSQVAIRTFLALVSCTSGAFFHTFTRTLSLERQHTMQKITGNRIFFSQTLARLVCFASSLARLLSLAHSLDESIALPFSTSLSINSLALRPQVTSMDRSPPRERSFTITLSSRADFLRLPLSPSLTR